MIDEWGLLPEDDGYHAPPDDDPWWTETTWFSWMVPERRLMGHWYFVMRVNSLASWHFDGTTAWGEDQDVWHPRAWNTFAREKGITIR